MQKIVFLTAIALLGISLGFIAKAERMQPGQLAPNWMLYSAESKPTLLHDITDQQKTVVMLFWATWCGQCNHLLHELQSLADAYNRDAATQQVGFSEDNEARPAINAKAINQSAATNTSPVTFYILNIWEERDAQAYLAEKGITLPVLVKAESVADRYGIEGVPGLVVVQPDRRIGLYHTVGKPVNQLMAQLKHILPTVEHSPSSTQE